MYDSAQKRAGARATNAAMGIPGPGSAELIVVPCHRPGRTYAHSGVMLARLDPEGMFELLTAAPWARALGYRLEELSGKPLRELIPLAHDAARGVVASLLDAADPRPLDVTLRCKDRRLKRFRFYRRYDADEGVVFVLADELAERTST